MGRRPHVVLSQTNPEIPVFLVKKENGEGRQHTLHMNLLLPIETNFDDKLQEGRERSVISTDSLLKKKGLIIQMIMQMIIQMITQRFSLLPQRKQNQCLRIQRKHQISVLIGVVTNMKTREAEYGSRGGRFSLWQGGKCFHI